MTRTDIVPTGAVAGFWVMDEETDIIPSRVTAPTGYVLPERTAVNRRPMRHFRALDLVPFDGVWHVLSVNGKYTYRHTNALVHREAVFFVPLDEWPQAYRVTFAEQVALQSLGAFGADAQRLARKDADSIALYLQRLCPPRKKKT